MSAHRSGLLALAVAMLVAGAGLAAPRLAPVRTPGFEAPALAPQPGPARLAVPRAEVPAPPDSSVNEEQCAVCRLAERTTGALPPGSFTLDPELSPDGAVVQVRAPDPQVRATLWQAMVARGALLEAMRNGEAMQLCTSCAARRSLLSQVEIRAQRTPSGLTLAYASKNPTIVEQLHSLVRGLQAGPVQF
jgi:hypothetical protein